MLYQTIQPLDLSRAEDLSTTWVALIGEVVVERPHHAVEVLAETREIDRLAGSLAKGQGADGENQCDPFTNDGSRLSCTGSLGSVGQGGVKYVRRAQSAVRR